MPKFLPMSFKRSTMTKFITNIHLPKIINYLIRTGLLNNYKVVHNMSYNDSARKLSMKDLNK
jgi:hypothetical protein